MPTAEQAPEHVELRNLAIREDRDEWIVGRVDNGEFVAMPHVGVTVLQGLMAGESVTEVSAAVPAVDVPEFVETLQDIGFVKAVDGVPCRDEPAPRSTLPRLEAHHVRWLRSPIWTVAILLCALSAGGWLWVSDAARPRISDLAAASSSGLSLVTMTALGWGSLLIHELGHLVVARAYGVPGRIRLGTRLQFLVAQTDISGISAHSLRVRLYAYCAGPLVSIAAATALVGLAGATSHGSAVHHIAAAAFVAEVAALAWELLVFMRTDGYFVLRDVSGCRNLYNDGWAYARWVATAFRMRSRSRSPLERVPRREQPWIRLFVLVLVFGSAACVIFGAVVSVPAGLSAVSRIYSGVFDPTNTAQFLDSLLAAVLGLIGLGLWMLGMKHQHGARLRQWAGRANHH